MPSTHPHILCSDNNHCSLINVRAFSVVTDDSIFKTEHSHHEGSEPGSSVSTVPGYGLDYRAIDVRSPAEAKGFFLQPLCPDRLWGPASCTVGTGILSPGIKHSRVVTLTTHTHLVPKLRMSRSYISSPFKRLRGVYLNSFRVNNDGSLTLKVGVRN
jgi:hypothetical protein